MASPTGLQVRPRGRGRPGSVVLAARLVVAGAIGAMSAGPASGQAADLGGTWEGQVEIPTGQSIRIAFHIEPSDDGWSVTWDSPDQGATGLPGGPVTLEGREVSIELSVIQGGFSGTLADDGTSIEGTLRQGPAELPLTLERSSNEVESFERPQEPEAPFPYRVEDVTYANATAGHELAGTLTIPEGAGPHPAAILISGSGPQDRDESLMGHRPFLVLADHLTRAGVAVLRFDDRGVGESGGDFQSATSADFATDVVAGVEYLLTRAEIDGEAIGLVGHSEGGLIAPMVASERDDVAYLVLLAGPGVPGDEILLEQGALIARASRADPEDIRQSQDVQRRIFRVIAETEDVDQMRSGVRAVLEEVAAGLSARERESAGLTEQGIPAQVAQVTSPWFRFFLGHDPAPVLSRVRVPVLALNGGKDLQVAPRQNLPAIERALRSGGNDDVTLQGFPDLNHLFQTAITGAPSEYAAISETFAPEALNVVSSWIVERFGR